MKNLRKFELHEDFVDAYNGDEYIEPWVSYTKEEGGVNYNKSNWARIDLNRWNDGQNNAIVDYGDDFDNSVNSTYFVKYSGSDEEIEYNGGPDISHIGVGRSLTTEQAVVIQPLNFTKTSGYYLCNFSK